MTDPEAEPFEAKPLSADEWISLLRDSRYVLRVSDGTGDGTFRFWFEGGEFYWRCLNWGGAQPCDHTHLSACLDGDSTTQLLVGGSE